MSATKKDELTDTCWVVGIHGRDDEFVVTAAYVQTHSGLGGTAIHAVGSSDFLVTSLKDANHQIVFQAGAAAVAYVRRADFTSRRVPLDG